RHCQRGGLGLESLPCRSRLYSERTNYSRENIMTGTRIFSIGIALTFLGSAASAQNLSDYVLSGAAAERAVTRVEINAATAEALVDSCIAHARDNDVSVSVFVLSPSGTIVHAQRMDGQTPINTETALYKA